jgi:uncharacterized membrane protein SirB2
MDYATLKLVHQSAVALSAAGFVVRGVGMCLRAPWLRARVVRIAPHAVDTVLLASAIGLAWTLQLNPLSTPWLAAKIVALLAYIALGLVALRPGRSQAVRIAAWIGALAVLGYIIWVALTRSPTPWLTASSHLAHTLSPSFG